MQKNETISKDLLLSDINHTILFEYRSVCSTNFDPTSVGSIIEDCFSRLIELELQELTSTERETLLQIHDNTSRLLELVTERVQLYKELENLERKSTKGGVQFSSQQRSKLEDWYLRLADSSLEEETWSLLADQTELSVSQVKNWFSHRKKCDRVVSENIIQILNAKDT